MAKWKTYPTPPEKLVTKIQNHRKYQIYLTDETCEKCMLDPPDGFYLIAMDDDYIIEGGECCRLEAVKDMITGEVLYEFPMKGKIKLY